MTIQELVNNLNLEKCPVHLLEPKLIVEHDIPVIEREFCCSEFKGYCQNKFADFVADAVADKQAKDILGLFDVFDSI